MNIVRYLLICIAHFLFTISIAIGFAHHEISFAANNSRSDILTIGSLLNSEDFNSDLSPNKELSRVNIDIIKTLKKHHYNKTDINKTFSSKLLDAYLSDLDNTRSYFLQSDIKEFEKYRYQLDGFLKNGRLGSAFKIYNLYRHRVIERLVFQINSLENGLKNMNFNSEEYITIDRSESPWLTTREEQKILWKRYLKNDVLSLKLTGKTREESILILDKRFRSRLNRIKQINSEDVFRTYMNSFSSLHDPHSQYFSPRLKEDFDIRMSLSLEGIGAVLQIENEYTKILRIVPAGPADKGGKLKPGDLIIAIGQGDAGEMIDVVGWRLDDVVRLIRGPKGTLVRIEVIPFSAEDEQQTNVISIIRETVKLEEQAANKEIIEIEYENRKHKIGIINIPGFYIDFQAYFDGKKDYRSTTRDVRKLITDLKESDIEGIIVDLRDNSGGALQEANSLTGLFIETGPVVQVRGANGKTEILRDNDPEVLYEGPLIVLVNHMSASASEIFAGAIKDYNRGIIIGSQTFGKGTVQSLQNIGHGQMKMTIAKFYRISGESTQFKGIIPDIYFPQIYDHKKIGESSLKYALPWDKISETNYITYPDLSDKVNKLRDKHNLRIMNNNDFDYIKEGIKRRNKLKGKKQISLNESVRNSELKESEKWRLDLENKLRISKGLKPFEKFSDINDVDIFDGRSVTEDKENEPDPYLIESGNVILDFIKLKNL
ncbi:MAG: carboxy terminal-processing peptidase [Desulfobacteraceae bacterium]|jgi:carboxyl-terminal processing protease|nr:carboxy terminal-processing peptidase [Desulfobacteraceae bacterium]